MKIFILILLLGSSCNQKSEIRSLKSWTDLGLEHAKKGEAALALTYFERAKKDEPKQAVHWSNTCSQKIELKRFLDAERDCRHALELDPKFELAISNLKWIDSEKSVLKKKIESMRAEIKALSNNLAQLDRVRVELGLAYYQLGEYVEARAYWSKIGKQSLQYATALNNLASVSILTGEIDRAETELTKAKELDPSHVQVMRNWVWLQEVKQSKK